MKSISVKTTYNYSFRVVAISYENTYEAAEIQTTIKEDIDTIEDAISAAELFMLQNADSKVEIKLEYGKV